MLYGFFSTLVNLTLTSSYLELSRISTFKYSSYSVVVGRSVPDSILNVTVLSGSSGFNNYMSVFPALSLKLGGMKSNSAVSSARSTVLV